MKSSLLLLVTLVLPLPDVAWINPYREGTGAIGRAMESVERLAGLEARWACSGHGPAVVEPERALDAAREHQHKGEG